VGRRRGDARRVWRRSFPRSTAHESVASASLGMNQTTGGREGTKLNLLPHLHETAEKGGLDGAELRCGGGDGGPGGW
jgi:hypothetical protein